ncbi:MAG: hypothetical protein RBT69_02425 [Spirochaetia bacterium]|jgi:hypothetical protein|nr:hypothetical protein [Spirochaetia bacterium]
MILVRKTLIIVFIALSSAFLLFLSSYSYFAVAGSETHSPERLKYIAENIFFFGLIGSILVVLAGSGIIFKSYRLGKALDKLINMSRNTGHSPDAGLRKLGKIGTQIADILVEMNLIGEKRALRISSFHNLVKKIIKTSSMTAAVVSTSGEIVFCTENFAEKLELAVDEVSGHEISEFVKDREINEMIEAAVLSRKDVSMEDGTIYPVVNRANETTWCLCVFNTTSKGVSLKSLKESNAVRNIVEGGGRIKTALNFLRKKKK